MKAPTGGWPFVVIVCVALAATMLTFAFLSRTTYHPQHDKMAPPTTNHTHNLLKRIERSPGSLGLRTSGPRPR